MYIRTYIHMYLENLLSNTVNRCSEIFDSGSSEIGTLSTKDTT